MSSSYQTRRSISRNGAPSAQVVASPNATNPSAIADSAITSPSAEVDSYQLALTIADAADDRKGADIVLLKVSDVSYLADYFVIATGFSAAQVRALAGSIEDKAQQAWGRLPLRVEGQADASWVLLDYGDVIVHLFMPKEREFYNLEAFWGHAEQLDPQLPKE